MSTRPTPEQTRDVIQKTDLRILFHELTGRAVNGKPVRCPLPQHPKTDPRRERAFQVHDSPDGDLYNCPLCGTGTAIELLVHTDALSYPEAIARLHARLASGTTKPESQTAVGIARRRSAQAKRAHSRTRSGSGRRPRGSNLGVATSGRMERKRAR